MDKSEPVLQLTVSQRRIEDIINDLLLINIELGECDDLGLVRGMFLHDAQRKLLEAVELLGSATN